MATLSIPRLFVCAASALLLSACASPLSPTVDLAQNATDAVSHPGRSEPDLNRDQIDHPVELLTFARVTPGMTVADVFGGGGYFSELLSYSVGPEGQVLLINNPAHDQYAAKGLEARNLPERLPNVTYLITEAVDLQLPEGQLDVVWLSITYHDLFYADPDNGWPAIDRDDFLAQIVSGLKPGGVLLVTDHRAATGQAATQAQSLHRIEEAYAREQIERSGLQFSGSTGVLANSDDDHSLSVFDPAIRGKTDRFAHKYIKP